MKSYVDLEEICLGQSNKEAFEKFYKVFMRIAEAAYDKGYDDARDKAWQFYEP